MMINIALAFDRKIIPQAYVLLNSILINHKDIPVRIFVLSSALTDEDKASLKAFFEAFPNKELSFLTPPAEMLSVIESQPDNVNQNSLSLETFYRLMLPDILPPDVDRILYLDIDMVVNKDLTELYEADFGGALLISSRDTVFDATLDDPRPDELEAENVKFFLPFKKDGFVYFCAGMILFDMDGLRREGFCFSKYMEIFSENVSWIRFADQDLLNFVHMDRVGLVDEKTCGVLAMTAHNEGRKYDDLKENAYIVHYNGLGKPWTVNLVRYDIEKLWWEYAEGTPYYSDLMQKVFYGEMDSTFAEDTMKSLNAENEKLKQLLVQTKAFLDSIGNKG